MPYLASTTLILLSFKFGRMIWNIWFKVPLWQLLLVNNTQQHQICFLFARVQSIKKPVYKNIVTLLPCMLFLYGSRCGCWVLNYRTKYTYIYFKKFELLQKRKRNIDKLVLCNIISYIIISCNTFFSLKNYTFDE